MPLPFDPGTIPTALNPNQYAPAPKPVNNGGSPFSSAQALSNPQQPVSGVSPFYNADTSGGIPSPLTTAAQQQYAQQANGLNNAFGGPYSMGNSGDDIYNNLMDQLSQMGPPDQSQLSSLAQQEAGLKYDPLIQQLQQSLATYQTNSKNASSKIGDLYSSLGKGLAAQIPGITAQFKAQENQAQGNYGQLQNQISNNYQAAQDAQAAELQKLGIEAALPQSTQQMTADRGYLTGQAANNAAALKGALQTMGQGQADFTQRASQIAPMQGASIQSDLAQKLLQLQNQTQQQITGYKGQEGAEAQVLLQQLLQQSNDSYSKAQSDLIGKTTNLAQLQNLVHPGIFGSAPSNSPTKYNGITGIQNYLSDNAQVADPNQLYSDYMALQNDKNFQQLTGPGGIGGPTLETAWPALQNLVKQIDPATYNNNAAMTELYNVLAIRYGKY